jgi:hypothetical protein
MSFVAGSIVGNLVLDTSGFTGGIAAAVSAAASGAGGMAGPILGALSAIKAAAEEAFGFVKSALLDTGKGFDQIAKDSERAGVSAEFLSRLGVAAQGGGSSLGAAADAMKFLNKNLSEAAGGGEEAVAAFGKMGIGQDELQGLLGNTEGAFLRVADSIAGMQNPADKTVAAMSVLGRGGTDLIPLLNAGSAGFAEWAEISDRAGTTVSGSAAKSGAAWEDFLLVVQSVWKGIKAAIGEPILAAFGDDAKGMGDTVLAIGEAVREMIPPIMALVAKAIDIALTGLQWILAALKPVAGALEAMGLTGATKAIDAASKGATQVQAAVQKIEVNLQTKMDADDSSSQIAAKIRPELQEAARRGVQELEGSTRRAVVSVQVGGRTVPVL